MKSTITCENCGGSGRIKNMAKSFGSDGEIHGTQACPECGGSGKKVIRKTESGEKVTKLIQE